MPGSLRCGPQVAGWLGPRRCIRKGGQSTKRPCSFCVYNLADDTSVDQMLSYHAEGYPLKAPPYLIEGTWQYRDLRAPESSLTGCAWMKEFLSWNATRDAIVQFCGLGSQPVFFTPSIDTAMAGRRLQSLGVVLNWSHW
ncbi:unnamed protein product [Symbiodinium sp. KB8]|nr:unnamed protein product [Symbiodinium sp. KB8]